MTQLVLSIPDKKLKSFLLYIHELKYVKVEDKEFVVPAWQQKEVSKRLKKIKADPSSLVSSQSAAQRLKMMRV